MPTPLVMHALDGANPLAFLAALGSFRLASLQWPDRMITLRWQKNGAWVPVLDGPPVGSSMEFAEALCSAPMVPVDKLGSLGKNITVSPETFESFASEAASSASMRDRRLADFCASFGCEAIPNDKGDRIQYTQLCFITGSGHQDFLGTLADLREKVTVEQVHHALFEAIDDPDKSLSFRWNPTDAKEYSLLWENPSKTGVFSTWGANLMAFEALPLYPCMPSERRLETTGFYRPRRPRGGQTVWPQFTWPIWDVPINLDEVRSLVALADLHVVEEKLNEQRDQRERLQAHGIVQCYRSLRVRIPPDGAQFKVSFRPSQAV